MPFCQLVFFTLTIQAKKKKKSQNSKSIHNSKHSFGARLEDFLSSQPISKERADRYGGPLQLLGLIAATSATSTPRLRPHRLPAPVAQQAAAQARSLYAASINDVSCFSRSVANRCSGSVGMKRRSARNILGAPRI